MTKTEKIFFWKYFWGNISDWINRICCAIVFMVCIAIVALGLIFWLIPTLIIVPVVFVITFSLLDAIEKLADRESIELRNLNEEMMKIGWTSYEKTTY